MPKVMPFKAELWLAGPVEETSKLLVPVLLLIFGAAAFKDPRAGFLLTLISGATFGALEGAYYVVGLSDGWGHLLMAIIRPISEVGHPLWTSLAGSLIWLGAWRRDKVLTKVGFVGYGLAMLQHSVHDGLPALFVKGAASNTADYPQWSSELTNQAVSLTVMSLMWAVIAFLILRHAARELVPPQAVAGNHKHWRPQIKAWALPKD